MIFLSLLASGLMLLLTNAVAWPGTPRDFRAAGVLAGACALVSILCLFSGVLALNCLLVLAVGFLCFWRATPPRAFHLGSLAATALAYAIVGGFAVADLGAWKRLQPLNPVESLEERLGFERRRVRHIPAAPKDRLDALESSRDQRKYAGFRRTLSLRVLHRDHVAHFIDSPGFGVWRGPRPAPGDIELPEVAPVPQPAPVPAGEEQADEGADSYARALPGMLPEQRPAREVLNALHATGFVDFLDPRRFGYVESRERVTGFRPHQFTQVPGLPPASQNQPRWRIERLELVSLLKHEEPAVYISQHLPRMDELRQAPTRPLDGFEQRALSALRRGEDLQVEFFRDHLRMLGPLYALEECTRCHSAAKGDLLGAFSYVLRPAP